MSTRKADIDIVGISFLSDTPARHGPTSCRVAEGLWSHTVDRVTSLNPGDPASRLQAGALLGCGNARAIGFLWQGASRAPSDCPAGQRLKQLRIFCPNCEFDEAFDADVGRASALRRTPGYGRGGSVAGLRVDHAPRRVPFYVNRARPSSLSGDDPVRTAWNLSGSRLED